MIVLSRIDNRLVHGQVIEAWLPHLKVLRLVVADAEAAGDPLARAAMGMALPPQVKMLVAPVEAVDFAALATDAVPTLVLFRDVPAVLAARAHGLPDGDLNVGNVHGGPGREPLSQTVYLSGEERAQLASLEQGGMEVFLQAVPSEKKVHLPN